MKNPVVIVSRSAALSLLAVQLSCGGGDASGPAVAGTIAANSPTTLGGSTGATVQDRPSVIVRDQSGTPLAGVTVTFAVTSGGGSLTGASPVTDASGIATVGSWTLGSVAGSNTVTASAGTLTPVVFTATATNPCASATAHTFGTTSNGQLTTSDCRFMSGFTLGTYVDFYTTTVSAAGAYAFTQSAAFDTFLLLAAPDGALIAFNDDLSASSFNSAIKALLPVGGYTLAATSFDANVTGDYTLSSASTSAAVTNCEEVWVTRGITTTQILETTDCLINGFLSDDLIIFLRAGQAVTVTMTSSALDAFLELYGGDGTRVAFNDDMDSATTDNAQLVYTVTADGFFIVVPTSAVAGATGAYTLTIQ